MEKEERVAYIISQSVCAMVTAMGMQAENEQRKVLDQSMAYGDEAFEKVLDDFGVHHNNVIEYLRD